jgi:hypothetical protein
LASIARRPRTRHRIHGNIRRIYAAEAELIEHRHSVNQDWTGAFTARKAMAVQPAYKRLAERNREVSIPSALLRLDLLIFYQLLQRGEGLNNSLSPGSQVSEAVFSTH